MKLLITHHVILLYSGKILRTINFAVFMDFTAALKTNSSKFYYVAYNPTIV